MSYSVAPLDIARHRPALVDLWKDIFSDPEDRSFVRRGFTWLYEESPADLTRTWVAIDDSSNGVVGCLSAFRSNKFVAGRDIGGGIPTNLAVDRRHRTLAPALALLRTVVSGGREMGIDVLAGKPTLAALPACQRAGYERIGDVRRWARLASGDTRPAGSTPGTLADDEQIVTIADARFDSLWTRARDRYQVIGNKSSAFLNWRYAHFAELGHRYFCLVGRDRRVLNGYVSFYPLNDGAFVVDVFADDPNESRLEDLMRRFVAWTESASMAWTGLSYFGMPVFEQCLARLGFASNPSVEPFIIQRNDGLPVDVQAALAAPDQWFTFGGEIHF